MHVYIAGPYTKPDPITNARRAIEAGDKVMSSGHVPFVPHLNVLWDLVSPRPYAEWLNWDLEWLGKCDAMIRLPGESPGADVERQFCLDNGIPVYNSVEAFLAANPAS